MRLAIAALLAASLSLAPAAGAAQPAPVAGRKTKVLVFDFTVKGDAAKDLGRVLADVAARELAKLKNVQALTQADVTAQLGVEKQKTMLGCSDDRSCMAEIAGAIDADRTLGGSVVQLGDSWLVSVTYVDARKAATVGGDQETLRGAKMDSLVDAVRRLSFYAATGKRLETSGAIDFDVAEPDARVLLDGEELGTGPYKATKRTTEGTHRVVVVKEGFAAWETDLRVVAGATLAVAPKLAALPKPVVAVQQLAPPEEPTDWYVEARISFIRALSYDTPGLPACSDSFSTSLCVGANPALRVGYQIDPSWAVEAVGGFWSYAKSINLANDTPYGDTKGLQLGAAGAWHPKGNRWLGVGAEAGLFRSTVEIQIGGTSRTESSTRPYGLVDARLDLTRGTFLLGLRAGLEVIGGGKGLTFTNSPGGTPTPYTITVSGGTIVSAKLGLGMGVRF